jgi:hypothetical protein
MEDLQAALQQQAELERDIVKAQRALAEAARTIAGV